MKEEDATTFDEACKRVCDGLAQLVTAKQHDYGARNILDFGEFGITVRLNDKLARLKNLIKTAEAPKNESLEDTWQDVAGYAIVALMLRRGWFELPLE